MSMASSNSNRRPNFFDLLGLDPDKPWNQSEFERLIEDKRRQWSNVTSHQIGQPARDAQRNLGLIGEMRRVMSDPKERNKEAEDRRAANDKQRQDRLDEFKKILAIAERKGYVQVKEIREWATKTFKGILTEQQIKEYVTTKVVPDFLPPLSRPHLEPVRAKEIREELQLLHYDSLYTLLSKELNRKLSETSGREVLKQAADELNRLNQQKMNKDAYVTAKIKLSGHAGVIFSKDSERQRYDETLRQEQMEELLQVYITACSPAQAIEAGQTKDFLRDARQKGWNTDEALDQLFQLASKNQWRITVPEGVVKQSQEERRCGNCKQMNPKTGKFCTFCKEPLEISCPNCSSVVALDQIACGNCGFGTGDFFMVKEMLKAVVGTDGRLLPKVDLREARSTLKRAEELWSPKQPDALAHQIAGLLKEAQQRAEGQERAIQELEQLLGKRFFFTAAPLLQKLPRWLPKWSTYEQAIQRATSEADRLVALANQAGTKPAEREGYFWKALQVCADCARAKDGLKQVALRPPSDLKIETRGTLALLRWTPSHSPGAEYVVVRKTHDRPGGIQDGEKLAETANAFYQDASPPIGLPVFYAVFAKRFGEFSSGAAQASSAVFLKTEVAGLKHQVSADSVELTWTPPPNVKEIRVVRKEGAAPASLQDRTANVLPSPSPQANSLIDRDVQEGKHYFYVVYCYFLDQHGQLQPSQGSQAIDAVPQGPPDATRIVLTFQMREDTFRHHWLDISWQPPEKGDVLILKDDKPIPLQPKQKVTQIEIDRYGQLPNKTISNVQPASPAARNDKGPPISDLWSKPGERYYLPVIQIPGEQHYYVGTVQRYVYTNPITNLKAHNLDAFMRLTWTWPSDNQATKEVLIGIGTDINNIPHDVELASKQIPVAFTAYHRFYDLPAESGDYYVIVAPVVYQENKRIVGAGVSTRCHLGPRIRLEYWLERLRNQYKLHIRTARNTGGAVKLPALMLRTNQGNFLANRNASSLWWSNTAEQHPRLSWEFPLSLPPGLAEDTYACLFLEDEMQEDWFELIPSDYRTLKLS